MREHGHSFSAERSWPAALECAFGAKGGRSVLTRLRFDGPLRIQRLFYPEKALAPAEAIPCHCCLLHPPGGLVSGDDVHVRCHVGAGAHCLMTTPAAGKIYRADSHGVPQRQCWTAEVADGVLEWLPLENILFGGADARLDAVFHLRGRSRLIGWDTTCFGRPAAGEIFAEGRLVQRTRITRNGALLLHDRLAMDAGDEWRTSLAGLQGFAVHSVFFACGREDDAGDDHALRLACEQLQESFARTDGGGAGPFPYVGVSCRGGLLIARYLGGSSAGAKQFCLHAWETTRPLLLRRAACPPRIWQA
jgi:urease accessory protein